MITEPPDVWKTSSEFLALYGNESERWKRTSYSIFFSRATEDSRGERSSNGASEYHLRCFGHAKLPPDRIDAPVKALKLPSPDRNYRVAIGTGYVAASEMLCVRTTPPELSIDGIKIDQTHAIDKLRLLGFSLLRLNQFMKR